MVVDRSAERWPAPATASHSTAHAGRTGAFGPERWVGLQAYERRSSTLMDEGPASTPTSARPRFSIQVSRLFAACRLPARQFRAINCNGMRLLIADAPDARNSVSIAVAHVSHT